MFCFINFKSEKKETGEIMTVYSRYNVKRDYKRVTSVARCFKIEIVILGKSQ